MTRFYIFIIRIFLAAIFAVLLSRFFYPKASISMVVGGAVALIGLAYITEYLRRGRKGPSGRAEH